MRQEPEQARKGCKPVRIRHLRDPVQSNDRPGMDETDRSRYHGLTRDPDAACVGSFLLPFPTSALLPVPD